MRGFLKCELTRLMTKVRHGQGNAKTHEHSSTPGSSTFGKHMTPEEVIDFFAPEESTVETVKGWLISSGISAERIGHSVNKQVRHSPKHINLHPHKALPYDAYHVTSGFNSTPL